MNGQDLPLWAAIPVGVLVLLGSGLALLGAIGFVRARVVYDRLHVATLASSGGIICIAFASMILFGTIGGRIVVHELLIAGFMIVTTPITMMLLGRAALYRDRVEQNPAVPPAHQGPAEPRDSGDA